ANLGFAGVLRLVEVPLALELFLADAVRFIPMDFSEPNPAVPQANPCAALHLPPVPFAIQASEPCEVADSATGRDRFDVGDVADEFEVHRRRILAVSQRVCLRRTNASSVRVRQASWREARCEPALRRPRRAVT